MHEESLKIFATNHDLSKKLKELKLEKEKLVTHIQESTSILCELKIVNETLKTQFMNLTDELERSSRKVSESIVENQTLGIQVKYLARELELSKS